MSELKPFSKSKSHSTYKIWIFGGKTLNVLQIGLYAAEMLFKQGLFKL